MATAARSLDRFPLVRTQNPEEMCAALERVYARPVLHLPGRTKQADFALNYYPIGDIRLSNVKYGLDLSLAYAESDLVMQTFPVRGRGVAAVDESVGPLRPGQGIIVSSGARVALTFAADYEALLLLIKPQSLAAKLAAITGQLAARPLRLHPIQDHAHRAAKVLRSHFLFFVQMVSSTLLPDVVLAEFEELLVVMFLFANRHNYSHLLQQRAAPDAAPWQVRRAEDYLEANAHRAVSVDEIADVAGASALSLFRSFQRSRGCSPRQFIVRLRSRRDNTRQ